ncbi:MAG: hypothetical protein ACYS67_13680, partial [Planctomycetota bacterium]
MSRKKDEKWLDEIISRTIESHRPEFDAEKWKQKYPVEFQMLQSMNKQDSPIRQPSIWRIVRHSPITKIAAAAGVVLAILVGIKIFVGSPEEPPNQIVTKEGPPPKVEEQRILKKLHTELTEVRQMADVGDVKGLAAMLSAGQFESKLVAANFLAKMGGMPALETLTMHASGELILDSQAGNIRIRSTNSSDWLEITADTLVVHTGQGILEARQVRLTYDIRGDDEQWQKLQRE